MVMLTLNDVVEKEAHVLGKPRLDLFTNMPGRLYDDPTESLTNAIGQLFDKHISFGQGPHTVVTTRELGVETLFVYCKEIVPSATMDKVNRKYQQGATRKNVEGASSSEHIAFHLKPFDGTVELLQVTRDEYINLDYKTVSKVTFTEPRH